ncbi:MAG: acylneuraminate cytidylyltransferase family protein [Proteobacteria bacterium]|nr:acylneuraminate cytidylyltransferase family protein [Pseudomonadota bacterium]
MTSTLSPLTLLPLRGGSRGIPGKNIRPFLNRPLFTWCATAAIDAGLRLIISTDDDSIRAAVRKHTPAAELLDRPDEFATDTASTEAVIAHALEVIPCDHILLLQATSPLTTTRHLQEAIAAYVVGGCKPLLSGTRQHHFLWNIDGTPVNYNPSNRPRRQDWSGIFVENGAFYIFSRKDFETRNSRCPPPCTLYCMEQEHAIELDTLNDWFVLEQLAKERH